MDNVIITYSGYILFILSSIMAYSQYRGKKKFETDIPQYFSQTYKSNYYKNRLIKFK